MSPSSPSTVDTPCLPAVLGVHSLASPASNLLSKSHRMLLPWSLPASFPLTPATLPIAFTSSLPENAPPLSLNYYTSSLRAAAKPVRHRADPGIKDCCIKEERKDEEAGKAASVLDYVTVICGRKGRVPHTAGCWTVESEQVRLWVPLLEAPESSPSQPSASPQRVLTVDVHVTDSWVGADPFTWGSQSTDFKPPFSPTWYTSDWNEVSQEIIFEPL